MNAIATAAAPNTIADANTAPATATKMNCAKPVTRARSETSAGMHMQSLPMEMNQRINANSLNSASSMASEAKQAAMQLNANGEQRKGRFVLRPVGSIDPSTVLISAANLTTGRSDVSNTGSAPSSAGTSRSNTPQRTKHASEAKPSGTGSRFKVYPVSKDQEQALKNLAASKCDGTTSQGGILYVPSVQVSTNAPQPKVEIAFSKSPGQTREKGRFKITPVDPGAAGMSLQTTGLSQPEATAAASKVATTPLINPKVQYPQSTSIKSADASQSSTLKSPSTTVARSLQQPTLLTKHRRNLSTSRAMSEYGPEVQVISEQVVDGIGNIDTIKGKPLVVAEKKGRFTVLKERAPPVVTKRGRFVVTSVESPALFFPIQPQSSIPPSAQADQDASTSQAAQQATAPQHQLVQPQAQPQPQMEQTQAPAHAHANVNVNVNVNAHPQAQSTVDSSQQSQSQQTEAVPAAIHTQLHPQAASSPISQPRLPLQVPNLNGDAVQSTYLQLQPQQMAVLPSQPYENKGGMAQPTAHAMSVQVLEPQHSMEEQYSKPAPPVVLSSIETEYAHHAACQSMPAPVDPNHQIPQQTTGIVTEANAQQIASIAAATNTMIQDPVVQPNQAPVSQHPPMMQSMALSHHQQQQAYAYQMQPTHHVQQPQQSYDVGARTILPLTASTDANVVAADLVAPSIASESPERHPKSTMKLGEHSGDQKLTIDQSSSSSTPMTASTTDAAAPQPSHTSRPPTRPTNTAKAPRAYDIHGQYGAVGLGKAFHFLEQLKLEVTGADRTIKTLHTDLKLLRDKNKDLEFKNRDLDRRLKEEKKARQVADNQVLELKKQLQQLSESQQLQQQQHKSIQTNDAQKPSRSMTSQKASPSAPVGGDGALSSLAPAGAPIATANANQDAQASAQRFRNPTAQMKTEDGANGINANLVSKVEPLNGRSSTTITNRDAGVSQTNGKAKANGNGHDNAGRPPPPLPPQVPTMAPMTATTGLPSPLLVPTKSMSAPKRPANIPNQAQATTTSMGMGMGMGIGTGQAVLTPTKTRPIQSSLNARTAQPQLQNPTGALNDPRQRGISNSGTRPPMQKHDQPFDQCHDTIPSVVNVFHGGDDDGTMTHARSAISILDDSSLFFGGSKATNTISSSANGAHMAQYQQMAVPIRPVQMTDNCLAPSAQPAYDIKQPLLVLPIQQSMMPLASYPSAFVNPEFLNGQYAPAASAGQSWDGGSLFHSQVQSQAQHAEQQQLQQQQQQQQQVAGSQMSSTRQHQLIFQQQQMQVHGQHGQMDPFRSDLSAAPLITPSLAPTAGTPLVSNAAPRPSPSNGVPATGGMAFHNLANLQGSKP